jgi:hypothetical protein
LFTLKATSMLYYFSYLSFGLKLNHRDHLCSNNIYESSSTSDCANVVSSQVLNLIPAQKNCLQSSKCEVRSFKLFEKIKIEHFISETINLIS